MISVFSSKADCARVLLLFLTGGIALFFTGKAGYELWRYGRLDNVVSAEVKEWRIEERSVSECLLCAFYTYEVKGERFEGKTLFKEPVYLNLPSAQKALSGWKSQSWQVWYQTSSPQRSSLQRSFPFKSGVHALLTLGVFFYFWAISKRACRVIS